MIRADEYLQHDAVGLSELFHKGEVSATELLDCAISQSKKLNPAINAIVFQNEDEARVIAGAMDQRRPAGLLAGVPFLIKEANAVKGWPFTRGINLLKNQVASRDSTIVQRYRSGDLLLFGSTNTPELCLTITTEHSSFGGCDNPCKPGHSTGGSSGGSAAAVAAGIVPAADATDGGGSIRIPASCCGLIGLKPSRGLSVVEPDMTSTWSGFSVGHVVTRSVRDSAAFLDLLRLQKPLLFALPPAPQSFFEAYSKPPHQLRIALQNRHPGGDHISNECLSALHATANTCARNGHLVVETVPPVDYARVSSAMSTVINVHVAQIVSQAMASARVEDVDTAGLSESGRRMVVRGQQTSASSYLEALNALKAIELQMEAFFQQFDVVLSPVLSLPPAELGWLDMNSNDMRTYARRYASYSPFTALYNATGQPSISLPLHWSEDGLPIGVMASAAWGQDVLLLQLAHELLPGILPVHARRQLL